MIAIEFSGMVFLEVCLIFALVSEIYGINPSLAEEAGSNSRCPKPRGQFPGRACNSFVNCWDGVATEQECPGGLLFSSKGYCDHAQNVNCNGRPLAGSTTASSVESVPSWTTPSPSLPVEASSATSWVTSSTSSSVTATLPPLADPALKKYCRSPRGQFPSPSCNKYVNCWDDIAIEQECPEGLLFSSKGYCDYPANVQCGERVRSNVYSSQAASVSECPLEFGTFRDRNNCSSFYTCAGNKIVATYSCPEGFKFNDNLGVCDYENRVDCSKEPLIFQTRSNQWSQKTEENNAISECAVEFGTFRDRNNCSTYYTCVAYKIVSKHDCPPGFYFNDDIAVCDYFNKVNCARPPKIFQSQSSFLPQLPTGSMEKINNCTPGTVIRLNPECTTACLCRDGVAEIVQCPAGLAYDSSKDKCVLPQFANC